MDLQTIGTEAVFKDASFTRGIKAYQKELRDATKVTKDFARDSTKAFRELNKNIDKNLSRGLTRQIGRTVTEANKQLGRLGRGVKFQNVGKGLETSLERSTERAVRSANRRLSGLGRGIKFPSFGGGIGSGLGVSNLNLGFGTLSRSIGDITNLTRGFGSTLTSVLTSGVRNATLLTAGVAGIGALGFAKVSSDSANFQQGIQDIAAVVSGITNNEIQQLRETALGISLNPELTASASDANQAILLLAKNGVSVEGIIGGIAEQTVALSNATGSDFATAADVATDALAVFNPEATTAEEKTAALAKINDTLVGALNNSKLNIDDFRLGIARAADQIDGGNTSFDEFATLLVASAERFSGGATAGTAFANVLRDIRRPTDQVQDALQQLGINIDDGQGSFLGLVDIITQVNEVFRGNVTATQTVNGRTAEQEARLKKLNSRYTSLTNQVKDYENGIRGTNLTEEKRTEKLNQLNRELTNTQRERQGLLAIQGEQIQVTKNLTQVERENLLAQIFTADSIAAIRGVSDLTAESLGELEQKVSASGQAATAAATRVDSLKGDITVFNSIVEGASIDVGNRFEDINRTVVKTATVFAAELGQKVPDEIERLIDGVRAGLEQGFGLNFAGSPEDLAKPFIEAFNSIDFGAIRVGIEGALITIGSIFDDEITKLDEGTFKLGRAFFGTDASAISSFQQDITSISNSIIGIIKSFTEAFNIPELSNPDQPILVFTGLLSSVLESAAENAGPFFERIKQVFDFITNIDLNQVVSTLQSFAIVLGAIKVGEGLVGVISILSGLGSVFSGAGLAASLSSVLAVVNPVTLAIGALALAVGGFGVVWENNLLGIQEVTQSVFGDRLFNALESVSDVLNQIGDAILTGAGAAFEEFRKVTDQIDFQGLGDAFAKLLEALGFTGDVDLDGLREITTLVGQFIGNLAGAALETAIAVIEGLTTSLAGLVNVFFGIREGDTDKILLGIFQVAEGIATGVLDGLAGLSTLLGDELEASFRAGVDRVKEFLGIASPSTLFIDIMADVVAGILEGATGFGLQLGTLLVGEVNSAIESLTGVDLAGSLDSLLGSLGQIGEGGLLDSISGGLGNLFDLGALTAPVDIPVNVEVKSPEGEGNVGQGVVDGIVNSVNEGLSTIAEAGSNLGAGLVSGLTGALGIESPSTVTFQIGEDTKSGLANSLTNTETLTTAVSTMGQSIVDGLILLTELIVETLAEFPTTLLNSFGIGEDGAVTIGFNEFFIFLSEQFNTSLEILGGLLNDLITPAVELFNGAVDIAREGITSLNELFGSTIEVLGNLADRFNSFVDSVSSFSLPGFLGGDGLDLGLGFAGGTGGWRTVPQGFPNDTFPVRLTSGEMFRVYSPQETRMIVSNLRGNSVGSGSLLPTTVSYGGQGSVSNIDQSRSSSNVTHKTDNSKRERHLHLHLNTTKKTAAEVMTIAELGWTR